VKDQTQAYPVLDQLLIGNELHDAVPGRTRCAIIFGVNFGRQRAAVALVVLVPLLMATACEAHSSVEAAQTAIVAAQTVLPGAQATAQAGATLVSNALATAQPLAAALQAALQGASVQVKVIPDGATPDAATALQIDATDAQGTLGQVDPLVRRAAATAALQVATQYYPSATITLTVKDDAGGPLVSGSVAPGQLPKVQ
jgi:hypothetical protein